MSYIQMLNLNFPTAGFYSSNQGIQYHLDFLSTLPKEIQRVFENVIQQFHHYLRRVTRELKGKQSGILGQWKIWYCQHGPDAFRIFL